MDHERNHQTDDRTDRQTRFESMVSGIIAFIQRKEDLRDDVVVLLADAGAAAMAVRVAAKRLSKSADEIGEAVKQLIDDLISTTGSDRVVVNTTNLADIDEE